VGHAHLAMHDSDDGNALQGSNTGGGMNTGLSQVCMYGVDCEPCPSSDDTATAVSRATESGLSGPYTDNPYSTGSSAASGF
jgi:hypothetical protein